MVETKEDRNRLEMELVRKQELAIMAESLEEKERELKEIMREKGELRRRLEETVKEAESLKETVRKEGASKGQKGYKSNDPWADDTVEITKTVSVTENFVE